MKKKIIRFEIGVVGVYLDEGLNLERNIYEGYRLIQRKDQLCKAQDSWILLEIHKQTKKN